MDFLSILLTGLAVMLALNSLFLRLNRRYIPANCGFASALNAQATALVLGHAPLWEPISLVVVGVVLLVLALVELVRERQDEAFWSEICPCCEHPEADVPAATDGGA